MNVERTPAFNRDLRRLRSAATLRQLEQVISELTAASNLMELANVIRRLRAQGRHYRIRVGDYRLGITMDGDTAALQRFLHRSEFYRYFP